MASHSLFRGRDYVCLFSGRGLIEFYRGIKEKKMAPKLTCLLEGLFKGDSKRKRGFSEKYFYIHLTLHRVFANVIH